MVEKKFRIFSAMCNFFRIATNNPTKLVFTVNLLGKKNKGRPKKRFVEKVERDFKKLSIRK